MPAQASHSAGDRSAISPHLSSPRAITQRAHMRMSCTRSCCVRLPTMSEGQRELPAATVKIDDSSVVKPLGETSSSQRSIRKQVTQPWDRMCRSKSTAGKHESGCIGNMYGPLSNVVARDGANLRSGSSRRRTTLLPLTHMNVTSVEVSPCFSAHRNGDEASHRQILYVTRTPNTDHWETSIAQIA